MHWRDTPDSRVFVRDGAVSLFVHAALIALVLLAESIPETPRQAPQLRLDLSRAVHLVAPRLQQFTQKDPNTGEVAKEVNVDGLLSRALAQAHVPQPARTFKAPAAAAAPPPAVPKTPQLLPEPPKIESLAQGPQNLPQNLPQFGLPEAPPPKSAEPKLALENPGQNGVGAERAPGRTARIPIPKTTVDDAIHGVVNGGGQGGGTTVGDEDQTPSIADQLHRPRAPAAVSSSLQLLSDPQGVDFKPYLIRILSIVRRNWMAIIPESAHMGRRGKVLLQFIVDRNGGVPKLVIAMPSGTEAFDRAAVAGISASVPFPALPSEFKGDEVRLQFAFSYNVK